MTELQPSQPSPRQIDPAGEPPAAPPRFTLHDVFVGADGLRAGWSLALFWILFFAALLALGTVVQTVRDLWHPNTGSAAAQSGMSPVSVLVNEGVPFLCVAIATCLMALIERRSVLVYGFSLRHALRNFGAGLAWGLALLSLLVVLLRAAGLLVFDARLLFGGSIARFAAVWLGNFLLVALLEETTSRGYLQFTLTRGLSGVYRWLFGAQNANPLGFWTAAVMLSFAFGLDHRTNAGESPLGLLSAGLAGFLFCLSLWRTGSLWWAIGFHATWDWAESFLYGVPDSGLMVSGHLFATHPLGRPYLSGGVTGPEGSIFLMPVMACGAAVVLLTLPRTNRGYQPANTAPAVSALDFS